ncbi:MAG TPA: glycosyltransferase family 4 protein [Casimicrobiaceae bacterium]|nr:glycosyltransferase family 4 protein [Casimicrobiaceae bacterium]
MRIAWLSPFPPTRSGIAVYSADVVPRLEATHEIDRFPESRASEFAWRARRDPYDLVVYQMGNAPCHDYMWAYLAAHPGLVVLHDARLHQARARSLLQQRRHDDYRNEFRYDHPDAPLDVAEFAVEGLGGPLYYFWSMLRVVMRSARMVAVHSPRVAADLRREFPAAAIETIRLGTAPVDADAGARARVRKALGVPDEAVLFAAFGKITNEKRIDAIVRSFDRLARDRADVHLMLAGDAADCPALGALLAASPHAARVHVTGYVPDGVVAGYLAAADASLCLRWPTALETSASWLQCLAASRPTVLTALAHLADIPTVEPIGWRPSHRAIEPVAISIDLLNEDDALSSAMRRLADDLPCRQQLGRAGFAYWTAHHTVDAMTADYERVLSKAISQPAPTGEGVPAHFVEDYSGKARAIADAFGIGLDQMLGPRP